MIDLSGHIDDCDKPQEPFVPAMLHEAAELYRHRNKIYGDNYKEFGKVFATLFPDGVPARRAGVVVGNEVLAKSETMIEYYNRIGILVQVVAKLTRYCANFDRGGHEDSLRDVIVYSAMLLELDAKAKVDGKEPEA